TAFVLGFVGLSTRIAGEVVAAAGGEVVVATPHGKLRAAGALSPGTKAFAAVRPERIRLAPGRGGENELGLPLRDVGFPGSDVAVHFDAGESDQVIVEAAQLPGMPLAPGAPVKLSFASADALAFPLEQKP